jgi:lysophospholipase L1-like esterase
MLARQQTGTRNRVGDLDMGAALNLRATRTKLTRGLVAALLLGSAMGAFAQVGPGGPGGPGGPRGGGFGAPPTPPGPAAEVPAAVRMARPTAAEVASVRASVDKIDLAKKYPGLVQINVPAPMSENTAIRPSLSGQFQQKHQDNLAVAKQGDAELLFMGDSITDWWRNETGNNAGKAVQDKYFGQWKVANFGIAGDTTQGVLYRLQNGEGKGFKPKAVMLMIGTNNTGRNSAGEIAEGVGAVVLQLQKDFPDARILLLGIFPRGNPGDAVRGTIAQINDTIRKLDYGRKVFYMDIGSKFLDASGAIPREIMGDGLHPTTAGYEVWAKAVIDPITALMNGRAPAGR